MIFKLLARKAGRSAAARNATYVRTMRRLVDGETTPAATLQALGHWFRDADRGAIDAVRDFRTIRGNCSEDPADSPVFWRPDQCDAGGRLPRQANVRYVTDEGRVRRIVEAVRGGGA